MDDIISRQQAIDDLHTKDPSMIWDTADVEVWVNTLPSAQPEPCEDVVSKQGVINLFKKYQPYMAVMVAEFGEALEQFPSAQPEIIRCRDCKHYKECEIFGKKITLCKRREYDSLYVEPHDFCSRAERRTDVK